MRAGLRVVQEKATSADGQAAKSYDGLVTGLLQAIGPEPQSTQGMKQSCNAEAQLLIPLRPREIEIRRAASHAANSALEREKLLATNPTIILRFPDRDRMQSGVHRSDTLPPATAKQEVEELLTHLPDDSTLEDIQYHLYVLEKVKHGRSDIAAGHRYSQEEACKHVAQWLQG